MSESLCESQVTRVRDEFFAARDGAWTRYYLGVDGTPGRLVLIRDGDPRPVSSESLPRDKDRMAVHSWIWERARRLPIVGEE